MARLEPVGEGIWTAALPLELGLFQMGTRTTVVRLPDGGLFVHSPAKLDPERTLEFPTTSTSLLYGGSGTKDMGRAWLDFRPAYS